MRSKYKKLGSYIRLVDRRNRDGAIDYLRGISSIYKELVQSKANMVGVTLSNYKVVAYKQFAFNPNTARMGDKIPIALNLGEECVVSSIYPVFEVVDQEQLMPEYLMMWFRRSEFDRYARFHSHGSAREIFGWDEMCGVELPIPHIDKQREIVHEYNTIVERVKLNEQLNQKLEETAQALYKQWFVDFEFPISKEYADSIGRPELVGKPYKTSGCNLYYEEELDKHIPSDWDVFDLEELTERVCVGFVGSCYDSFCSKEEGVPLLRTTDLTELGMSYKDLRYVTMIFHEKNKKSQLKKGDILVARHGSNGMPVIFDRDIEANCLNTIIIKPDLNRMPSKLLQVYLKSEEATNQIRGSVSGSVQEVLNTKRLASLRLAYPKSSQLVKEISSYLNRLQSNIEIVRMELECLANIRAIILARVARG